MDEFHLCADPNHTLWSAVPGGGAFGTIGEEESAIMSGEVVKDGE